jgi:hypothetical protein
MVKLGCEWRGWRRKYCRMQGIDSPSSRSCCCWNIAILPLFLWISIHPRPRPTSSPQKSGQLLHVTRGLWLPCLANESLTLQKPILFVSHNDQKKGEFHHTSLLHTIKINGLSTIITKSAYTTESDDLVHYGTTSGEAKPTHHLPLSYGKLRCLATTHPQLRICPYWLPFASARHSVGEKRDTSPWDRLCKTGMEWPAVQTLVCLYWLTKAGQMSGKNS